MNTSPRSPLSAQAAAALQCVKAVAEAIQALGTVPSSKLYAQVMGVLTLDQYTSVIALLTRAGLVTERNHVLTWVGPAI